MNVVPEQLSRVQKYLDITENVKYQSEIGNPFKKEWKWWSDYLRQRSVVNTKKETAAKPVYIRTAGEQSQGNTATMQSDSSCSRIN